MARETRAIWATRVERWQRSGLDATTFARRERCNPRTLTYWRWRLGKTTAAPARRTPAPAVSFVEVVTAPSAGTVGTPVEVVLPAGYRLRLTAEVTPTLLQTVLAVLEGSR
jgi:transposase